MVVTRSRKRSGRTALSESNARPAKGLILIVSIILAGCAPSDLPRSGFVTRYVTGWDPEDQPTAAMRIVKAQYPNKDCRNFAQTRVSDAAESFSSGLSDADQRRIFDLTYADCVKWGGR